MNYEGRGIWGVISTAKDGRLQSEVRRVAKAGNHPPERMHSQMDGIFKSNRKGSWGVVRGVENRILLVSILIIPPNQVQGKKIIVSPPVRLPIGRT